MKFFFSRTAIAVMAAGIAGAIPVSPAVAAVPAGKAIADIAATARSGDVIPVRFTEKTCGSWRRQGQSGNKYAGKLFRDNCRGRNTAERRGHWSRQCDQWHQHSKRGQRYHAYYRDHCRDHRARNRRR